MEENQKSLNCVRSDEILSSEHLGNNKDQYNSGNMTKETIDCTKEQLIQPKTQKYYEKYIGIGLWILGYSMSAWVSITTKWVYVEYPNLHPTNINFTKAIGILIWSAVISLTCRVNPFVLPRAWLSMLAIKAVIQSMTTVVYYYIISELNIFIASQLYSTMAIFLIIFSHWFGKSKMTPWDFMLCLGWFFGVFCIEAANFYTSSENASLIDILSNNLRIVLMFVCLLWAMGQAINVLASRELNRYVHVSIPTTYTGFLIGIAMFIVVAIDPDQIDVSQWDFSFILCSVIISLFWTWLTMIINLSWKFENPAVLAPFDYTYAVIVFCADLVVFETSFYPLEVVGWGIIIFCTLAKMITHTESDPIKMEELQEEEDEEVQNVPV